MSLCTSLRENITSEWDLCSACCGRKETWQSVRRRACLYEKKIQWDYLFIEQRITNVQYLWKQFACERWDVSDLYPLMSTKEPGSAFLIGCHLGDAHPNEKTNSRCCTWYKLWESQGGLWHVLLYTHTHLLHLSPLRLTPSGHNVTGFSSQSQSKDQQAASKCVEKKRSPGRYSVLSMNLTINHLNGSLRGPVCRV